MPLQCLDLSGAMEDALPSWTKAFSAYTQVDVLGAGEFGKVLKCVHSSNGEAPTQNTEHETQVRMFFTDSGGKTCTGTGSGDG